MNPIILAGLICTLPVVGLINPNFTPVNLVKESQLVLELQVDPAALTPDEPAAVRVVRALKGKAPAEGLEIFLGDPGLADQLHEGEQVAAAFLSEGGGYIQIGGTWVEAFFDGDSGAYVLVPDSSDKNAVWAGSAAMLVRAAEYIVASEDPMMPVNSGIGWESVAKLGTLEGSVDALVDLPGWDDRVLVASDGGDLIVNLTAEGIETVATLATASRRVALAEMDGDGRWDLVGWDGESLHVLPGAEDGFAAEVVASVAFADEVLDIQPVPGTPAVLVSTAGVPQVASLVDGALQVAPLHDEWPDLEELAPARPLVRLDLDRDGRDEWVQPLSRGYVVARASGGGLQVEAVSGQRSGFEYATSELMDIDHDGHLDVGIAGGSGLVLWRNAPGALAEQSPSGETDYVPNAGQQALLIGDFSRDGIQDLVVLYRRAVPHPFFNRGFATFGFAMGLDLSRGQVALRESVEGQQAGALRDLNGDGALDLVMVLTDGTVYGVLATGAEPCLTAGIELPDGSDPVVVRVRTAVRDLGAWHLAPGAPIRVGCTEPGPVTLTWVDAAGAEQTQELLVVDAPVTATLGAAAEAGEDAGW